MSALFEIILDVFGKWFNGIIEKLKEKPKSIPVTIVAILVSYYLAIEVLKISGWITLTGYVFAVVYGLVKIIDDPYRPIKWAVGYILGQQAIKIGIQMILPQFKSSTDFIISLISILLILYVCVALYLKAKELKDK